MNEYIYENLNTRKTHKILLVVILVFRNFIIELNSKVRNETKNYKKQKKNWREKLKKIIIIMFANDELRIKIHCHYKFFPQLFCNSSEQK